ncbi:MAG: DUF4369 domain-containing protein [Bacteroidota bacterium]
MIFNFNLKVRDKTILLLFFLILSSCGRLQQKQAIVYGQLKEGKGEKIVLTELETKTIRKVDSVTLDTDGSFRFTVNLPETGFYMVHAPSGKVIVMLLNPGDTVNLSGMFPEFPDQVVLQGTGETGLLDEFFRFTRRNENAVDSLELLLAENQDSSGYFGLTQRVDTAFKNIWDRQRAYELEFIGKHPSSLVSLIVLNYAFGLNGILSPETDFACFERLDSSLTKSYPENKHVKYHHQRLMEYQRKHGRTLQ